LKIGRRMLGPKFQRETDHLGNLHEVQQATIAGRVPLGITYLDDVLGGIYPRDLLLLGAGTGVGKTELAFALAAAGAAVGKQTYLFALEAEVGELAARAYYRALAQRVKAEGMDFGGWWRGKWRAPAGVKQEIEEQVQKQLANIWTLYKERGDFTPAQLAKQLEALHATAEMVVLDHLHVIDMEDRYGRRAEGHAVRALRDHAIDAGIPVVAVSHVRKRQPGQGGLIPDVSDLHGDSALSKVATGVVLLARDWDGDRPAPHLSPTFVQVAKDRRGRASSMVARVMFDTRCNQYEDTYTLGRLQWEQRRQIWVPVDPQHLPAWASNEARRKDMTFGV
jgi:replicative DNA helicase